MIIQQTGNTGAQKEKVIFLKGTKRLSVLNSGALSRQSDQDIQESESGVSVMFRIRINGLVLQRKEIWSQLKKDKCIRLR